MTMLVDPRFILEPVNIFYIVCMWYIEVELLDLYAKFCKYLIKYYSNIICQLFFYVLS